MRPTRIAALLLAAPALIAQVPAPAQQFHLANAQVKATLNLKDGRLAGERLETQADWAKGKGPGALLETDGDFRVEIIWNDWQAPGKANNGDVFCRFGAKDFTLAQQTQRKVPGGEELSLIFKGPEHLGVEVHYTLGDSAHYLRRKIRVFEYPHKQYSSKVESPTGHLLHAVYPYDASLKGAMKVQNPGSFGQPVALELAGGGAFAGLEWPAADNAIDTHGNQQRLRCGQEFGEQIPFAGLWSETAVLAVTPNSFVKDWFTRYFDDIRVAKLRPYTLYNSWYDLRSAEYPRVKPHQVMNEENSLRIARMVRENMVEKYGITMDAFVLDDGWDVYRSGWELRKEQFPRGLKPLVDELKKSNTRLGIWYGPTGGYSMHDWRTDWWKANGYEVTDSNHGSVVGPKYTNLFQQRTTDMAKDGVAYFKWDGIQFVDNNPANGGPIGLYSRRAAMKNVIGFCESVRKANPEMYLNVTSGTWLSPWWMKYADQIWMDGGDFGAADVPSISTRDSSITYRDMVLYEDFHKKNLWFPVSNLMTHGILKGHIDVENIGKGEPLTKFADEVVFYLSRGVTMYELYIAPDILNQGEWKVLSESLKWARANFDILKRGEMVGGDPGKSEAYGHVHFAGDKGFLALRNPDINATTLKVKLDPAQGLASDAKDLVLERVYPTRWIAPRLFKASEEVELPLQGYESAVYQLRPLGDVKEPLLAGVVFEARSTKGRDQKLEVLEVTPEARVLNPAALRNLQVQGKGFDPAKLPTLSQQASTFVQGGPIAGQGRQATATLTVGESSRQATFGVLLRPTKAFQGKAQPVATLLVNGVPVLAEKVDAAGVWTWYTVSLAPGTHRVQMDLAPGKAAKDALPGEWSGSAQFWVTGTEAVKPLTLTLKGKAAVAPRLQPPTGRGPCELPRTVKLGEVALQLQP